jgi:hypothetical protein
MVPTVFIARKTLDGVLAAVIAARAAALPYELRFHEDEDLIEFFDREVQRGLPDAYRLVVTGLRPRRRSLSGGLIRDRLIDALRALTKPVVWLSAEPWAAEDLGAVGHEIGQENLHVEPAAASSAALARRLFAPEDEDAATLAAMAGADLREGLPEWAGPWREVLDALRIDPPRLRQQADLLVRGMPEALDEDATAEARAVREENRRLAGPETPWVAIEEARMAHLRLPEERLVFRREIGALAQEAAGARWALLGVVERGIALLEGEPAEDELAAEMGRYLVETLEGFDLERDGPGSYSLIAPPRAPFEGAFEEILAAAPQAAYIFHA